MARYFLILAVVLCGWCSLAPAQTRPIPPVATEAERRWSGPFFFIQMTDPQFGFAADNRSFEKETEWFGQAIAAANRLRPAFVVITGDLTHRTGDTAQEDELLHIAGQLHPDIPLYLVAGNHDVAKVPTTQSLAHYRQRFGPDWYSFDRRGCHFVVIDSSLVQEPGQAGEEPARQSEWLKRDLESAGSSSFVHRMLFLHHPPFVTNVNEPTTYTNLPGDWRKELLAMLAAGNVRQVFAGHLHRNASGNAPGLEIVASGPVGKALGKDPVGLRIVKVYRDRVEHQYVALAEVPERIVLDEQPTFQPSTQPVGR